MGAAGAALFALLAFQLLLQGPIVALLDPFVSQWWAAHRAPAATFVLLALTQLHGTLGIDAMLLGASALLAWQRRWRDALWLLISVQAAIGLNVLLKLAFARPRPALHAALVHLETFSFPSGHALATTVLWGCVVLLVPQAMRQRAAAAAALLVVLVAFSRVYLGAHYLADVLAGIGEGLACVALFGLLQPATRSPVASAR